VSTHKRDVDIVLGTISERLPAIVIAAHPAHAVLSKSSRIIKEFEMRFYNLNVVGAPEKARPVLLGRARTDGTVSWTLCDEGGTGQTVASTPLLNNDVSDAFCHAFVPVVPA